MSNDWTIIQGDSLEMLRLMPSGIARLIVTSPPYNNSANNRSSRGPRGTWKKQLGIDYGAYDDNMPEREYQEWQIAIVNECLRILTPDGTLAYNHKDRPRNWGIISPVQWLSKTNAIIRQVVVWDRCGSPNVSPWQFAPTTEYVYLMGNRQRPYFNPTSQKHGLVWRIPPMPSEHPAPFPVQIPRRCIAAFTAPGDLVIDPFSGSGTSILEAVRENRRAIGIELNPDYVQMSEARISNDLPMFNLAMA